MESALVSRIYLDLELVLDTYSLLFCVCRARLYSAYGISLANTDLSFLYAKSVREGVRHILERRASKALSALNETEAEETERIVAEFLRHLPSLKPTVLNLEIIAYLGDQEAQGGPQTHYISALEEETLKPALALYAAILPEERVLQVAPTAPLPAALTEPQGDQQRALVVTGSAKLAQRLTEQDAAVLISYVQYSQFAKQPELQSILTFKQLADVPFASHLQRGAKPYSQAETLKRVDLGESVSFLEIPFWRANSMPMPSPLSLSGRVVPGFKRGSKELGVPTANLEMTVQNEHKVASLVPGVYCGIAVFRSSESNAEDL